jgi:hypothetical protein|tara:strand:+ start:56 stop:217 length:162 start_codon:yes stop_codon:yes gene_type:complete
MQKEEAPFREAAAAAANIIIIAALFLSPSSSSSSALCLFVSPFFLWGKIGTDF